MEPRRKPEQAEAGSVPGAAPRRQVLRGIPDCYREKLQGMARQVNAALDLDDLDGAVQALREGDLDKPC